MGDLAGQCEDTRPDHHSGSHSNCAAKRDGALLMFAVLMVVLHLVLSSFFGVGDRHRTGTYCLTTSYTARQARGIFRSHLASFPTFKARHPQTNECGPMLEGGAFQQAP